MPKFSQENQVLIDQIFSDIRIRIAKERFSVEEKVPWATCLNSIFAYGKGVAGAIENDPAYNSANGKTFLAEVEKLHQEVDQLNIENPKLFTLEKVADFIERFKELHKYFKAT